MILSFKEFNDLYESSNGLNQEEYSNGIEVMESLLTVMQQKEILSESEVVTFLDSVLEETGWELNDEVYENYSEWIADWSQYIDEGINEDESELLFTLTRRGHSLLEKVDFKKMGQNIKSHAKQTGNAAKIVGLSAVKGAHSAGQKVAGAASKAVGAIKANPGKAAAIGAGAAAAGYGVYKGVKALKARSAAKKANAGK